MIQDKDWQNHTEDLKVKDENLLFSGEIIVNGISKSALIDEVVLAENTQFETKVTRYSDQDFRLKKALIEEIVVLKDRIKQLEKELSELSSIIEGLQK